MNEEDECTATLDDFIYSVIQCIRYWEKQENIKDLEKLEGLAFSILNIFDGTSSSFSGTIETIEKLSRGYMMHEVFLDYLKEIKRG